MADMDSKRFLLPKNTVDFHVHILPDLDDGTAELNESLEMADLMCRMGIHTAVATPHYFYETDPEEYIGTVWNRYIAFCIELKKNAIPLKLLLGFEVRSSEELIYAPYLKKLAIRGTSCMLVEPPFWGAPSWFDEMLYTIRINGLQVVLAHPERCECFIKKLSRAQELAQKGVLMQCSLGSLEGIYGLAVKRTAHKMLASEMVDVIGTDAHSLKMLQLLNKKMLPILQRLDDEQRTNIFEKNARNLLE